MSINKPGKKRNLSRRDFLRISSASAAAVAAGGLTLGTPKRHARAQSKTQLTFVWPFAAAPNIQSTIIDMFNEQSSSVEVELQILPQEGVVPALTTAFSAGEGPDVVAMSPGWLTQFSAPGWLVDLEDFISGSGIDETLLPVGMIQGRMYKNTAYMVPCVADTYPMFYNVEHFEEAGIAGPPETQEEFAAVAEQLTDFSNNRYGYYQLGGPAWSFQQWSTWMIGHGGIGVNNTMYEEDGTCILRREAAIEGLENWLAIYQDAQASPQASATGTFNDAANAFNAGQVSIVMGFLGYIQNFNNGIGSDKFAVAMPPSGPDGQYVHYGINGYSINASLDDSGREAAWELVQFMLTPEINALLNEDWGSVPTALEALDAEYLDNPVFDVPKAMLQLDEALVHTPRELPEWGNYFVNLGPELVQSAMLGQSSAADFAEASSVYLEEALQANS